MRDGQAGLGHPPWPGGVARLVGGVEGVLKGSERPRLDPLLKPKTSNNLKPSSPIVLQGLGLKLPSLNPKS